MAYYPIRPLFPPGEILFSPAVAEIELEIVKQLLNRHLAGYWVDDLCANDSHANEQALANGGAILSHYYFETLDGKIKNLVVMTESDRSYTVIFILGEPGFPSVEA